MLSTLVETSERASRRRSQCVGASPIVTAIKDSPDTPHKTDQTQSSGGGMQPCDSKHNSPHETSIGTRERKKKKKEKTHIYLSPLYYHTAGRLPPLGAVHGPACWPTRRAQAQMRGLHERMHANY